jgi:flagellum-specific peptidoglycan hydrolase FlgJ
MPVGLSSAHLQPTSRPELEPQGNERLQMSSGVAARDFAQQLASSQRAVSRGAQAPQQVRPQRTPLSGSQAAAAIQQAYTELVGRAPSQGTLAILTSQWSLETGQGERMYNYNFAGIKGQGPEGYTATLKTREGWGPSEVHIRDGFRAYTTAESGAKDYVSLLLRKYGPALDAADAEDPAGFASKLKAGGYYTGNEQSYASAVTRLANSAMRLGFDAVGVDSAQVYDDAPVIEPYFLQPNRASALPSAASRMSVVGEAYSAMAMPSMDAFAEEISRAALRIAARYGV